MNIKYKEKAAPKVRKRLLGQPYFIRLLDTAQCDPKVLGA